MFPDMLDLLKAIANGDPDAIEFAQDMADTADMNGNDQTATWLNAAAQAGRKLNQTVIWDC